MPKVERVDVFDDLEYQGGNPGSKEVEATETREFSIGGQSYVTYLCKENAERFDELFSEWTEFAEKVQRTGGQVTARKASTSDRSDGGRNRGLTARMRKWAQEQDFSPPVSDHGRIPDRVSAAYFASFPEENPAA